MFVCGCTESRPYASLFQSLKILQMTFLSYTIIFDFRALKLRRDELYFKQLKRFETHGGLLTYLQLLPSSMGHQCRVCFPFLSIYILSCCREYQTYNTLLFTSIASTRPTHLYTRTVQLLNSLFFAPSYIRLTFLLHLCY